MLFLDVRIKVISTLLSLAHSCSQSFACPFSFASALIAFAQADGELVQEVPADYNGLAYTYRGGCLFGEATA